MSQSDILNQVQEVVVLTRSLSQNHLIALSTFGGRDLSSTLSKLSAALIHTETLLEAAGTGKAPHNAYLKLSDLLSKYVSLLKSHLNVLNDEAGRNVHISPHGLSRNAIKERREVNCRTEICESINTITSSLIQSSRFLEKPHLTAGCTPCCRIATNNPKHQATAPVPCSDRDQALVVLSTGCRTDRENQDKHVHFADDPPDLVMSELPASFTFPAELPGSFPPRPAFTCLDRSTNPGGQHHRRTASHSPNRYDPSDDDATAAYRTSSATNDELPLRLDSPRSEPDTPPSPPPPYSPYSRDGVDHYACTNSQHMPASHTSNTPLSTTVPATRSDDDTEVWVDPITLACRKLMQERFPTTALTIYSDYMAYREQVRCASAYNWYLNFRYLSLVFQPDLPMQVFMVDISSCVTMDGQPSAQYRIQKILAYLFEDCFVFARSPFVSHLPDPNAGASASTSADGVPLMIDSGLEVLEDQSLRLCHIRNVTELNGATILLESAYSLGEAQTLQQTKLVHIKFQTTCQRRKVLQALEPWLEEDPQQQDRGDDTVYGHRSHLYYHHHEDAHFDVRAKKHGSYHRHVHLHHKVYEYHDDSGFHECRHDEATPRHHKCHHHRHHRIDTGSFRPRDDDLSRIARNFVLPIRLSRSGIW